VVHPYTGVASPPSFFNKSFSLVFLFSLFPSPISFPFYPHSKWGGHISQYLTPPRTRTRKVRWNQYWLLEQLSKGANKHPSIVRRFKTQQTCIVSARNVYSASLLCTVHRMEYSQFVPTPWGAMISLLSWCNDDAKHTRSFTAGHRTVYRSDTAWP